MARPLTSLGRLSSIQAPCLVGGDIRACADRRSSHGSFFCGNSLAGGCLRTLPRVRISRSFALVWKSERIWLLRRSLHVHGGPALRGRARTRTAAGNEPRLPCSVNRER